MSAKSAVLTTDKSGQADIGSEAVTSAYEKLTPARRAFVDAVTSGEIPTQVVRRMRPHLKRPDVIAWKWMQRADVKAAIDEMQLVAARLDALEKLVFADLLASAARGTRH